MMSRRNAIPDFVYPNRCGFCADTIKNDKMICCRCFKKVEFLSDNTLPVFSSSLHFDGLFVSCRYDGLVKSGILRLKSSRAFNTARYICTDLADRIERAYDSIGKIDLITCIPMSEKQKKSREYNQAEVIARRLSHELGVPFVDGLIVKADTSFHQHDQSVRLRRELADLVYMANADARCAQIVKGKTVLVCDDIVTTGSTLSKCAKVLKDEGASKVYAAALAG